MARVRTTVSLISPGTELRLFRGDPMALEVWEDFANIDEPVGMARPESRYRPSPTNATGAARFPVAFGYNTVGRVVAVGDGVSRLRVGDRVRSDARHQELYDARDWELVPIPDAVPDDQAVFAYLPTLGLHGLRRAGYRAGESVVVVGLGIVGLGALQVAYASGARIIGVDLDEQRRRVAAAALPPATILDPRWSGFEEELARVLYPHGPDVVIDAAAGPASLDLAVRLLDVGGRLVVISLHPEEVGALLGSLFYAKELTIVGTANDPYADPRDRRYRFTHLGNVAHMLALQADGRVRLDAALTHRVPAMDAQAVYAAMAAGRTDMVGVLLDWGFDD
jgi:threonine dehydrogenase-like Zn-dependent dehydrogenase